ncbi:MAG TPA: bifunctional nuclease domain-containing protein [Ignavibacteriales bacterium]|nr:bifunctional nuclease domain-containing protein [Ignavibacteriales bacterium]HEX3074078.1 bifunctional nuclease domain-containing protein [Ignavibacteriales bacterium]
MNKVQVEILGLSSSPSTGGAYALLLKEMFGSRRLPIIIGSYEAQAIALEMEGIKPPRPLTHDLLKNLIDNLGATIQEVIVDELRENTFFAKIVLEISTLTNEIDARPSDAIALAVRADAPIYVREEVMNTASFTPSNEGEPKMQEPDEEDNFEEEQEEKPAGPAANSKEAKVASLQEQLREALEREDYERAAKIRDAIKKMTEQN